MTDYYFVLGIDNNADEIEIKKAYRTLAMKYHPDRNPDDKMAESRFREITEAYGVLMDPAKRREYDEDLRFRETHRGSGQMEWHLKRTTWEKHIKGAGLEIVESYRGPTPETLFVWVLKWSETEIPLATLDVMEHNARHTEP